MKQISRRYGIDALKEVAEKSGLEWVLPREAREQQVTSICCMHFILQEFLKRTED